MSQSRRLEVLQGHLGPAQQGGQEAASLAREPTAAAQDQQEVQYSVILPERLTEKGPWLVRRWALLIFRTCQVMGN